MKNLLKISHLFLLLSCVACGNVSDMLPETHIPINIPDDIFCFREANAAYAASFSSLKPIYYNPINPSTEFLANEYLLAYSLTDKRYEYEEELVPEEAVLMFDTYTGQINFDTYKDILPQLKSYLFNVKVYLDPISLQYIEIRTEELLDISITANTALFGRPAGESLNDKFELYSTSGHAYLSPFFISTDKRLFTENVIQGLSIDEFLQCHPLCPAITYLKLKEIPTETPVQVQFTVTITIKDKAPISATTRAITLLNK